MAESFEGGPPEESKQHPAPGPLKSSKENLESLLENESSFLERLSSFRKLPPIGGNIGQSQDQSMQGMEDVFEKLNDTLTKLIEHLNKPSLAERAFDTIKEKAGELKEKAIETKDKISEKFNEFKDDFRDLIKNAPQKIENAFNTFKEAVEGFLKAFAKGFNAFIDTFKGAIKEQEQSKHTSLSSENVTHDTSKLSRSDSIDSGIGIEFSEDALSLGQDLSGSGVQTQHGSDNEDRGAGPSNTPATRVPGADQGHSIA